MKSRKGISPILATLLLIVIAVAAIVATYAWMMTYISNTEQQANVMLSNENVKFTSSTTQITISNSGTGNTQIVRVYLSNSYYNMTDITANTNVGSGVVIHGGSLATIIANWPNNMAASWMPGQIYYFKVVPSVGHYVEFSQRAPQSSSTQTGSNWWNPQYGYRQLVTITNNEASTLPVGYSVEIPLDTASLISAGRMLADCSDLRIVYWEGSSWVELDRDAINSGTSSTQVWFKTQAAIGPSPSADSDYYLYYGNPAASNPPANKSNVYLWFDDFNRASEADITSESAYIKTNGGTWSIEGGMLKNIGASGDPNKLIVNALGTVNCGIEMFTKLNVTNWLGDGDEGRMGLTCCMDTSDGEGYCSLFHNDLNTIALLNDLRSWGSDTTFSWTTNALYCMRFRVTDPSTRQGELKTWLAGTPEPAGWTLSGDFGDGDARGYGEVGVAGSRRADITYFDNFQIRYAVNLEPTVNLGSQETFSG